MENQTSGGRRRRRGGAGAARPVAGQLRGGAPLVWEALYVPGGGAGVAAPKIAAVVPIASGRCQAVNKYAENLVHELRASVTGPHPQRGAHGAALPPGEEIVKKSPPNQLI